MIKQVQAVSRERERDEASQDWIGPSWLFLVNNRARLAGGWQTERLDSDSVSEHLQLHRKTLFTHVSISAPPSPPLRACVCISLCKLDLRRIYSKDRDVFARERGKPWAEDELKVGRARQVWPGCKPPGSVLTHTARARCTTPSRFL